MVDTRYSGITQAAQQEKNWGLFRVVEGKKKPWSIERQQVVGKDDAFNYKLNDMLEYVDESEFWLGYCPRPGSAYVALDFDHVIVDYDNLVPWAEDILGGWRGHEGVTPSGEGLRVLLPRTDDLPEMQSERAGLGYYGGGGIAVTVPLECLEPVDADDPRAMMERFWQRMEENKNASASEGGQSVATQDKEWRKWWMSRLSDNEQAEAIAGMITYFGDVSDRHDWLGFMFACKSLQDYVTCDVFSMWDAHCRQFDGYDAEENEYQWHKAGGKKDGGTSWLWLRSRARQNGWPEHQWEPRRELDRSVLGGLAQEAPGFEQRVEEIEQTNDASDDMADAMERIQNRYVFYEVTGNVFDIEGSDVEVEKSATAVTKRWAGDTVLRENPRNGNLEPVNVFKAWLDGGDKRVTDCMPILDPKEPHGWLPDREVINTYRPFTYDGEVADNMPDEFMALVKNVAPKDWRYLMDWIATKVQRPWERQVAIVNTTPVFGTGRGTLTGILGALLGGYAQDVSAAELYGREAGKNNGYMKNLLVVVNEASSSGGLSHGEREAMFEKLKEIAQPNASMMRIQDKYVRASSQMVYTSFFIASNNRDALPLKDGDRRFSVLEGGNEDITKRDGGRYLPFVAMMSTDRLHTPEARYTLARIHAALMTWKVTDGYQTHQPLINDAKEEMINLTKSSVDHLMEQLVEGYPILTTALAKDILSKTDEYRDDAMAKASMKRQVEQWMNRHTDRGEWIEAKNGSMSVDGKHHKVRVYHGCVGATQEAAYIGIQRLVEASVMPRKGDYLASVLKSVSDE